MKWRLRNEDGTSLPMFQGKQGVLLFDESEEDDDEERDDDSYLYYLAKGGGLIHYENQQFLDMVDIGEQLRKCELIP